MSDPLIIAMPSKGRLKEQVEAWLGDCGLRLVVTGGARGYMADLKGLPGAQVRLLSAGDIAQALDAGEVHLGITGEDLLRERGGEVDRRILMLRPLGFGRADLVVAAPKSWLDVETMADLEEVAHEIMARSGRRMRVATKYMVQTRSFFARHGVADYRITESAGATEGAPASGAAELVVDITTTGATLMANGLKILSDGVILRSQAQLAAGLGAAWSTEQMGVAEHLLRVVEARGKAHESAVLAWSAGDQADPARLVPVDQVAAVAIRLTRESKGPVTASRPDFVFETRCESYERLETRLKTGR